MYSIFRSLRWRIQAWYAIILLLSILGFGLILHWELMRSHWDDIDSNLVAAARILEGGLRRVPRSILDSLAQDLAKPPGGQRPPPRDDDRRPPGAFSPGGFSLGPGPPPPGQFPPSSGQPGPNRPDFRRPPPGRVPDRPDNRSFGDRPPFDLRGPDAAHLDWSSPEPMAGTAKDSQWEQYLDLPRSLPQQLGGRDGPAYYVIWRKDYTILKQANVPEIPPNPPVDMAGRWDQMRYLRQSRGPYREVFLRGPNETIICVGRSIVGEHVRMTRMTLFLVFAGSTVFAIALFGGWWTTRRALVPIEKMGQTANSITVTNLSQRMDLGGVDIELEKLGGVLNNMLDRLDSSFEQQRRFTADASHELRTPLAIILSTTELALSKERTPSEYKEHLEKCLRSAQRMHQLVESLLTLARIDAVNEEVSKSPIELNRTVDEGIVLLQPLATENGIDFQHELVECRIVGNAQAISQVVVNLLTNAINYNHRNGIVRVTLEASDKEATLAIENTGPGIPASHLPHVFERFYRVDQSRTRSLGGNGLGLAICDRIVRAHGGSIEVDSSEGGLTRFKVRLPISG